MSAIDTGDFVLHTPSGENWVVAFVCDDFLFPCGWPLTRAKLSDCSLIERATPAFRQSILADMAAIYNESDPRYRYARAARERREEGNGDA